MPKIKIPVFGEEEVEISDVIQRVKQMGKTCELLRQNYPSVWSAMTRQYKLDTRRDKTISEELFEKKLEVMIMQDDEYRKK